MQTIGDPVVRESDRSVRDVVAQHAREAPVVLITGCSAGIGRAAAVALVAAGYRVVATARHPEALAGLGAALTCRLDVTDEASIRTAGVRLREHREESLYGINGWVHGESPHGNTCTSTATGTAHMPSIGTSEITTEIARAESSVPRRRITSDGMPELRP
jgi:NAD(P)-dependent dehydrogenase (short-subunit alcohol dehydrogenase family)